MTRHQPPAEVHTITSAPVSHQADLSLRMRKYLISMSIRTLCFVLAVVFEGPLRWVFVAAAVILPYVAVVMANSGPRRAAGHTAYTPEPPGLDDGRRGRLGP